MCDVDTDILSLWIDGCFLIILIQQIDTVHVHEI